MKKRILKKLVSENFVSAKARVSSDYVAAKFSLLTDIEAKFYNFEGIFLHISLGTRIQQQLGVKMMMITSFIICLMLSVSCDKSRIMIGANTLENTFDFLR